MAFLELVGRQVYFEQHGEGPLVILLHHGFGSSEMWRGVLPHLVMAGYRVVTYDRRCYGQSEQGEDYREFYFSEGFRDAAVAELTGLMAALELGPAHLVGQCEGGVVALDMARLHPASVKSLVAASTQCYSSVPMPELNKAKFPLPYAQLDHAVKGQDDQNGRGRKRPRSALTSTATWAAPTLRDVRSPAPAFRGGGPRP